jgi:hypothetical protein
MDETITTEETNETSRDLRIGNLNINGWAMFYLAVAVLYVLLAYVELSGKNIKDLLPATSKEEPQVIEGSVA